MPEQIDAILMRALQRDPDARWQSAFDLFTALDTLRHESGLEVPDRIVAEWVAAEVEEMPADAPAPMRTAEIEIALEQDIEDAFARVRMPSFSDAV